MSKIEQKVELREYRTQHHFLSDFRIMFNNCRRFNGPDSGKYGIFIWQRLDPENVYCT